jgi:hypothetical protein
MILPNDNKDSAGNVTVEKTKSPEETKQEQTDPNLTELKGLVDPNEDLEPAGTDNDV